MHAGHRLVPHTADSIIEAWGPDRCACLTEAMTALVALFAEPADGAVARAVPVAADPGAAVDILVALLEEVIYVTDVLGVVPIRFHLVETEDGGVAGDMEVVDSRQAVLVGPVPKAVSYHDLSMTQQDGRWTCHAVVDV